MNLIDARSPRQVAWWTVCLLAVGCQASSLADPPTVMAMTTAPPAAPPIVIGRADAIPLRSIATDPLPLTPAFSQDVEDYCIRCRAGANAVNVTVTDMQGVESTPITLVEDQTVNVRGLYRIRCLPHDFPAITVGYPTLGSVPTPGYYLVNSLTYAMALDVRGTPVWYARGPQVMNVDSVATNTISYMPLGIGPFGHDDNNHFEIHQLDASTLTSLVAVGTPTDFHEFLLLPNGNHMIFAYFIETDVDLTGLGTYGPGQTIGDPVVQEIDPSGVVVWSWRAIDHLDPATESLEPLAFFINGVTVVDVFHFNSIDVDASDNLLISARYTNSIYYVDRETGKVQWKLGGTSANKDGAQSIQIVNDPQGTFSMQHDARFTPNGHITLFDDHGASPGVARGVEYELDLAANTATMVFQTLGTVPAQAEGSFRRYPDGHSVIGWGLSKNDPRVFTEVDALGNDVMDVGLGGKDSYRAVKVRLSQLDIGVLRATTAK